MGKTQGDGATTELPGSAQGGGKRTPDGAAPVAAPAEPRPRVSWDEYFMNIARSVATRSTCPRKFVGSVIVRDRTILSTG